DSGARGAVVGSGYRFLRGVNRSNYFLGGQGFRRNCLQAFVAFHNSRRLNRQFVALPAGDDLDPAALEVAFGRKARRVGGFAGAKRFVGGLPVGADVPVIFQRTNGTAHVIAAVHDRDHVGNGVVVLLDPQVGQEADVSDATKVWVIPAPQAEPAGPMV